MEESDAGNSRGSCLHAIVRILVRHAAKRDHRDRRSSGAGSAQGYEPVTRRDELPRNNFFKSRSEENQVRAQGAGMLCFGCAMAGDGDDGRVKAGVGVDLADLTGRERIRLRGKVDTMRCYCDGHVSARVDEQLCLGAAKRFEDAAAQSGECRGGEVFFAKLDVVDALSGPVPDLPYKRGLLLFFCAGKPLSVCDRVAEHQDKCTREPTSTQSRGLAKRTLLM